MQLEVGKYYKRKSPTFFGASEEYIHVTNIITARDYEYPKGEVVCIMDKNLANENDKGVYRAYNENFSNNIEYEEITETEWNAAREYARTLI